MAICALMLALAPQLQGQSNGMDDMLFSIGDQSVTADEFEYVYRKNNPTKKDDFSRESVEEYLDLYINFKLKVKEARELRIDTLPGVMSELERYRQQLVKSYYDKAVTDKLAESAYDRMLVEVETNHIMATVTPGAKPEDTLAAYNKIQAARAKVLKGADFATVAKEVSDDPTAKENGGYIGFVTGLQIPDNALEDAIFDTKEGAVSEIFRSRYGYHIVKPGERRRASGKVKVAHMLFKIEEGKADDETALDKANTVREMLGNGADWDSLASVYSEDKSTAAKGGVLQEFGVGKMVAPFETAAFALKAEGDISEPVKTQYGYHVIQLREKVPLQGYDEAKPDILRRLQRSGRYEDARNAYIRNAQKEMGYDSSSAALEVFRTSIDSSILVNTWRARKASNRDQMLFKLGAREYSVGEFAAHVERSQRAFRDRDMKVKVDRLYDQFLEEMTIEFALSTRDENFRRLLQEYRDGILLFELTEEKVWQKAMQDSTGLASFYVENSGNYIWEERVDASILTLTDASLAKKIKKSLKKNEPETVAADYEALTVVRGLYLPGQNAKIDAAGKEPGLKGESETHDESRTMIYIHGVVAPTTKSLDEAKGYVISDYQEHLEELWVAELREKYPVKISGSALDAMIR